MGQRIEAIKGLREFPKGLGKFLIFGLMVLLAVPAVILGVGLWFLSPDLGDRFGDWYLNTMDWATDY